MRTPVLVVLFFAIFYTINTQGTFYYQTINGVDIINTNVSGRSLSFASNLQRDESKNTVPYTLYFLADKSSPNLYTAQFNLLTSDPESFWLTGKSILNSGAPFVSFDVLGNNIIGPAYPSGAVGTNTTTFSIQIIYEELATQFVQEYAFRGYTFYSVLIDPVPDIQTLRSYVYLAGWASESTGKFDPFVIARGTVRLNSPNPNFQIDPLDVLSLPLPSNCYDLFDEVVRPEMNLTKNFLLLMIPGRCAYFAKIPIPATTNTRWGQINLNLIDKYDPLSVWTNSKYLSTFVFDHTFDIIYFILKSYGTTGSTLYSFSTDFWRLNIPYLSLTNEFNEFEPIIVLGTEIIEFVPKRYLFVVASGAFWIQRFEIHANLSFQSLAYGYLTPSINQISSAYYFSPYLYFTTYEPDAKVARIPKNNFCGYYCGENAYCRLGVCNCLEGYLKDVTDPKTPCKLAEIVRTEIEERQSQGAAAALGVLFAFTLLAALAGWILWYRIRKV